MRQTSDLDWRVDGACAEVGGDVFFPTGSLTERRQQQKDAKRICQGCEVLDECRDWALHELPAGVAGGMTATERRTAARDAGREWSREFSVGLSTRDRAAEGRRAIRGGMTIAEAATHYGVHERTATRWSAQARDEARDRARARSEDQEETMGKLRDWANNTLAALKRGDYADDLPGNRWGPEYTLDDANEDANELDHVRFVDVDPGPYRSFGTDDLDEQARAEWAGSQSVAADPDGYAPAYDQDTRGRGFGPGDPREDPDWEGYRIADVSRADDDSVLATSLDRLDDDALHDSVYRSERYKDTPTERFARDLHDDGDRESAAQVQGSRDAGWLPPEGYEYRGGDDSSISGDTDRFDDYAYDEDDRADTAGHTRH